jgi:hypothetical protein
MARTHFLHSTGFVAIAFAVSCSANSADSVFTPGTTGGAGGSGGIINTGGDGGTNSAGTSSGGVPIDSGPIDPGTDCAESAKKIYLVTKEETLYAFNPEVGGMSAYTKINQLACNSSSTPQSMSVDRSGKAYVFYSSGELFLVDTTNAQCTPLTQYKHPANCLASCQLGMGFTADAPSSKNQILYIQSPDFGLSIIDTSSFAVDKKNVFSNIAAELTGGSDGKLFRFEANSAELAEITQATWEVNPIHTFNVQNVGAWAFARYAGVFYMFTASSNGLGTSPTKTTSYDPVANLETTRDKNLGFTVVGAGQSTCVPPPAPK